MARARNQGVQTTRVNDGYASQERPSRIGRNQRQLIYTEQRLTFGPLPSAEELRLYNEIVPGMAERLLVNVEKQTDHRIAIEKKVIDGDIRRADRGTLIGGFLAISVLIASVFLISTGHESIGVVGLLTEFVLLGGSFAIADYRRRQERNRKAGG